MKGTPRAACGFSARTVQALAAVGSTTTTRSPCSPDADIQRASAPRQLADHRSCTSAANWWATSHRQADGPNLANCNLRSACRRRTHRRRWDATPAAIAMLRNAVEQAGEGIAVQVLSRSAIPGAAAAGAGRRKSIATTLEGCACSSTSPPRRANGLSIDWADDERGRGLVISHPSAPPPVPRNSRQKPARAMLASSALTQSTCALPRTRAGRAASASAISTLGVDAIEALPKDAPIAFLCHHGGRGGGGAFPGSASARSTTSPAASTPGTGRSGGCAVLIDGDSHVTHPFGQRWADRRGVAVVVVERSANGPPSIRTVRRGSDCRAAGWMRRSNRCARCRANGADPDPVVGL